MFDIFNNIYIAFLYILKNFNLKFVLTDQLELFNNI